MLRLAFSIAAAAAIQGLSISSSHAQTSGNAPWCAMIEQGGGRVVHECYYWSIEECRVNIIGGDRGVCNLNPYFHGAYPAPGPGPRKHWRHHAQPY